MSTPKEFISAEDASRRLDVPLRTVHRWIRDGMLPAYQPAGPGGRYLIRESDFEAWVKQASVNKRSKVT